MRSIAVKLTLAFLLVGLTGSLLVALILRQRTRSAFDQFILNREQQTLVNSLVEYYGVNGSWSGVGNYLRSIFDEGQHTFANRRDFRHEWGRFTLVGQDRQVLFSILPDQAGKTLAARELARAIPLKVDEKTAGWLILSPGAQVWTPNSPEAAFLRNINTAALLSALAAGALALFVGGLLAFTMTRSLRELTNATVEIAQGKLGRQVKVRSKDELGELAESFNKMSTDLENATRARRQMTADIAHDLRSPLSVLSGYAEALSDGKLPGNAEVYGILYQETQHLSHLIEDLRLLSLADAGELPLTLQPIDPQVLLDRVAARHAMAAQRNGISLRVEKSGGIPPVSVDMERMAQVFDNLVTNAFRYTPQGGEVILAAKALDGVVRMQVRDNGSGIAAGDLPHIFDRFYKGDKARQHSEESGLGLAIAKSIVEAHGGTIMVESAPDQGSTFTIELKTA